MAIKKIDIVCQCYFCDNNSKDPKSPLIFLSNPKDKNEWGICSECINEAVSFLIKKAESSK